VLAAVTPAPFQLSGDTLSAVVDILPLVVLIIVVVGVMLWLLAWMARYFEYLKNLENPWLDRTTLDFVRRVLEGVWIAIMSIGVLAIAQTRSQVLHDLLIQFVERVPALFFFVFVMFAAAVTVRIFHRFAAYLRGELRTKPKRVAPPSALAFAEIVLKYLIYIVALVIAVLGGIGALPPADQDAVRAVVALPSIQVGAGIALLIGIILVVIADRLVESIFEDVKHRTKKFTAVALEEFKSVTRYAVWILGAIIILFVFLSFILSSTALIVFAVGFVTFLVIVALIAFEPLRDAIAGIMVMRGDPFDVGDRVKIGDDLVCDIVSMSLTKTQVRTVRGELVILPNEHLHGLPVVNFTRSRPSAILVEVAVAFEVAHSQVADLLTRAAVQTPGVVKNRTPEVYGSQVEGDSVVYQLFAFTDTPDRMKEIKSEIIGNVQDLFGAAGIRPKARTPPT
jgi:small-conductance mechanosensitive channel